MMSRYQRVRRVATAVVICAVWGPSPGLGQDPPTGLVLTLGQCEELAFENNLLIQDAELGVATAQARSRQADRTRILPRFDLRNIWGPINKADGVVDPVTGFVTSPDTVTTASSLRYFTQLDIDMVQPLFTAGKLRGLSDAAAFGVEADEHHLASQRANVRLRVQQLYWALVLGRELLGIVENTERELTSAEQKVEEKLDEGSEDVSQTDLFKLQLFRYEVDKRLREANDHLALTKAALRSQIGLPDDQDFATADEFLEPVDVELDSLPVYFSLTLQNRPELARLRSGIDAKRALVRVQKSDYYPQLFLAGQIRYNFAKDRFDPKNPFLYNPTNYFRPAVVLGMSMNLNFWQTGSEVGVAQAEFAQLAQKEVQLQEALKLEVRKSYLDLEQARGNLDDSRRAVRAGDNWLRSATMTFDIGVGEVKDLIDAFKASTAIQAEHLQNIFDFNVAAAKLSQVVGRDVYSN